MFDIIDLLREDQIEEDALCLGQCIEVRFRPDAEALKAGQTFVGGALDHMVANRQRARGRDDAEQSGLLQIEAATLGPKPPHEGETGLDLARGLDQQLGEGGLSLGSIEGILAQAIGKIGIAVHGPQVKEDVDRQQIPRVRSPGRHWALRNLEQLALRLTKISSAVAIALAETALVMSSD